LRKVPGVGFCPNFFHQRGGPLRDCAAYVNVAECRHGADWEDCLLGTGVEPAFAAVKEAKYNPNQMFVQASSLSIGARIVPL